jgi:hypothetical protein
MLYNHASAILINLLFFNIDHYLRKITGTDNIAVSPLMDCFSRFMQVTSCFCVRTLTKEIVIPIAINNFSVNEIILVKQSLADMIHDSTIALNVICKKNFSISFEHDFNKTINTDQFKEIVISVIDPDNEKNIHVLLPFYFFRLFSNSITEYSTSQAIEDAILRFFINPRWMLPDISYLCNTLSATELMKLINYLQKNNLLTPYQIFLLINAYPELSVTIKSNLSQNTINDVIQYNKDKQLKITKRDIAGGIYSMEESLLMITREGIDVSYSRLLRHIQHIVQLSLTSNLLLKNDFSAWMAEIQSHDLLYATVSTTEDALIAAAISRDSESYLPLLRKFVTERKIDDIRELVNPAISYDEIMKARIAIILNYRKLRIKRIPLHPDRFEYLLTVFSNPDDYQYLLFYAGWFTLSSALKGLRKNIISSVVNHIPYRARVLIEDVLKGIVNPNILQDEMQINKARLRCESIILQLYHDGLINLE